MFEVGGDYQLEFGTAGESNYRYGVVIAYDHPLIKMRENESGKETIFNAAANNFLSAVRRD